MRRPLTLLPLSLLICACAGGMSGGSAPASPPFDPAGSYDATVETAEGLMPATMTISSTPEGYTGSMGMAEVGTFPLTDIAVADAGVTFWVTNPFGRYFVSLTFDGDRFTGTYESETDGGYLSGTKRR